MATTPAITTVRKDLLFNARKLAVVQWRYSVPLITTLKNPTTGALVLPDNGYVVGAHRKQRGGDLANAQTYNDIMIHGSGSPALKIPTERRLSVGVEPVELNRINLQNWLGADFSAIAADAAGGVHLPVPSLPINMLSRVALIGRHTYNALPVYLVWVGNRVDVSDTGNSSLTDAEVASFPYTFNFQDVEQLNDEPVFVEIFGEGWELMQQNADAGFIAAVTALNVTPAAPTVDLSAGETQQLSAEDNNGVDRTNAATWTTSDATKATVSTGGLVTPVATGTATITATYSGQTDTATVTVVA